MGDDKEAKNFLAMINMIRKYQNVDKFQERAQAGAPKSLVGPYNFYLTSSRSLQFHVLTSKCIRKHLLVISHCYLLCFYLSIQ